MDLLTVAIFFLTAVAVGGVGWVLAPLLSGEAKAEKRVEALAKPEPARGPRAKTKVAAGSKREQVEAALKDLELRQKNLKNPPLHIRLQQAGLSWSTKQFWMLSIALGVAGFLIGLIIKAPIYVSGMLAFVLGFGLPRWLIGYLKNRRIAAFLNEFPNAVDVIVRGVKAGLPFGDCIRIIANEASEPVKSEFRTIVETQALGIGMAEAVSKLYERMPLPEANFFCIVITIQQKSGGNLSETLGNLSKVLRDRKKMKAKITALSMEAKASAAIIAALPVVVMLLVYLTSPKYIELLWITELGRIMLAGCAMLMFTGVMIMRKMINFDF